MASAERKRAMYDAVLTLLNARKSHAEIERVIRGIFTDVDPVDIASALAWAREADDASRALARDPTSIPGRIPSIATLPGEEPNTQVIVVIGVTKLGTPLPVQQVSRMSFPPPPPASAEEQFQRWQEEFRRRLEEFIQQELERMQESWGNSSLCRIIRALESFVERVFVFTRAPA